MFIFIEAFKSLARAKFASIITIVTIMFASFLVTGASWIYFSTEQINKLIAERIEVRIFLKEGTSNEDREDFIIKLKKDSIVKDVRFISKAIAATEISKSLGISIDEVLSDNPLPDALLVKFKRVNSDKIIKTFVSKVKQDKIVDDVIYEKLLLAKLNNYLPVLRYTLLGLAVIFVIVAFYLVLVVNRMVIERNSTNYDIMKLVGAKLSTIRMPIIINGVIISTISVILSTPIIYLLFKFVNSILALGRFEFDLKISIIVFVIFTFILGIVGSLYSSKKVSLRFKY